MINKFLVVFTLLLLLVSCQTKNNADSSETTNDTVLKVSKFQMYEMSELAMLMEQMYAYNSQLRYKIINKDSLGEFPIAFEKIHTAIMTDPSENDVFFQDQSALYLSAQKAIYSDPKLATANFNKMVESCLACHTKKCGGPIPKIKKLFIK